VTVPDLTYTFLVEGLSGISNKLDPYIAYAGRVRRSQREGEEVELDEESIETLKSLGYNQQSI
jgi:hypothetical protein